MALSIPFKSGRHFETYYPLSENVRENIRAYIVEGYVTKIIADGHEGVACMNAYRRMQGEPPMEADSINYQVCYSGDIAISVLLNLIYNP